MLLSCPTCEAQYRVPDDAIPPVGRNVQCASCAHVWFVAGVKAAMPEKQVEDTPDKDDPISAIKKAMEVAAKKAESPSESQVVTEDALEDTSSSTPVTPTPDTVSSIIDEWEQEEARATKEKVDISASSPIAEQSSAEKTSEKAGEGDFNIEEMIAGAEPIEKIGVKISWGLYFIFITTLMSVFLFGSDQLETLWPAVRILYNFIGF